MILGYDSHGAEVVEQTKEYRTFYKRIPGLVVIEYIDKYSYCLDTNKNGRWRISCYPLGQP